ncbi:ABC transporter permease [Phytoactinopolyspora mesophila]|uniref:ABC transporter permease subunit n=1 Tax=Phytoactinopolyspora mesophila TaxID=2650750 RepID=A0A7K3M066_9ACTN|nr:ABC transporter permease [Phytoactinopolyspora mesophila]NDL56686.1 ABC transporter permease subunit [Phytoactinopolyspora mesophila]
MTDVVSELSRSTSAQPAPPAARKAKRAGGGRIRFSATVISIYVAAAIFGPWLVRYDAVATSTTDRLLPPGSRLSDGSLAIFGTDDVGRDLLAQILQGARISIAVGVATLLLAGLIGVTIGVIAGYFGGWLDGVLMRLADVQLTFPSILLAIFIAALLGPSVVNVVIVLAISNWVTFARVARAQVLATKRRDFVDATRTIGAGTWHLIRRCILPACTAPILVVATVEIGGVILAEASLSFLGLGTPTNTPSWGLTIANGRDYLSDAWWISTIPGLTLAILVVSFGILGDALRDRFDPKLKNL